MRDAKSSGVFLEHGNVSAGDGHGGDFRHDWVGGPIPSHCDIPTTWGNQLGNELGAGYRNAVANLPTAADNARNHYWPAIVKLGHKHH